MVAEKDQLNHDGKAVRIKLYISTWWNKEKDSL